jgi:hypothetical protein
METVEFKSNPEFFVKEKNGQKPNTVRVCDDNDDLRFVALRSGDCKMIRIRNTITGESFEREIMDVSVWHDVYIVSWRHKYGFD